MSVADGRDLSGARDIEEACEKIFRCGHSRALGLAVSSNLEVEASRLDRRARKKLKRRIVYLLARVLIVCVGLLPEGIARLLGRAFGAFAYRVAGASRRRAIEQMQVALQIDLPAAQVKARALFRHLGLMIVELALLWRRRDLVKRWLIVADDQRAVLDRAVQKGRGVIAVSAHLGNWELLPQIFGIDAYDVFVAGRENPNPYLDQWIVDLRARNDVKTLHRGSASSGVMLLRALRRGAIFAVLIDQDTRVKSVFVPFFGRPASTPVGVAELALRTGAAVVAAFIVREGDRHRAILEEIDCSGDATDLTARLTARIEHHVCAHPEQWVWFHERWKRQP